MSEAVTTAVLSEVRVPAVTPKEAVDEAAATVTEEGVVRLVLLSEMTTEVAVETALESVTVQVAGPPELREEGEQEREVRVGSETRLMEEL